MKLNTIKGPV